MALDVPATETLRVSVDAARAEDFARETGFVDPAGDSVPISYPAVWLSAPPVHGAIMRACSASDNVPVHESQSFTYEAPLLRGAEYELHVSMRREETPPRLHVECSIATLEGAPVGQFETVIRLVPRASLSAEASS